MNPFVDKSFGLERVDHLANAHWIDAEAVRELTLTASRPLLQVGHDRVDHRGQAFTFKDFSGDPKAYLMEAARQMSGDTMRDRDRRSVQGARCLRHLRGSKTPLCAPVIPNRK